MMMMMMMVKVCVDVFFVGALARLVFIMDLLGVWMVMVGGKRMEANERLLLLLLFCSMGRRMNGLCG